MARRTVFTVWDARQEKRNMDYSRDIQPGEAEAREENRQREITLRWNREIAESDAKLAAWYAANRD